MTDDTTNTPPNDGILLRLQSEDGLYKLITELLVDNDLRGGLAAKGQQLLSQSRASIHGYEIELAKLKAEGEAKDGRISELNADVHLWKGRTERWEVLLQDRDVYLAAAREREDEALELVEGFRAIANREGGMHAYQSLLKRAIALHAVRPSALQERATQSQEVDDVRIPKQRRVVCAAIRAADGELLLGIRHYSKDMADQIAERSDGAKFCDRHDPDQGFVDQHGNYMTREEAYPIALAAGQIIYPDACYEDTNGPRLYSEGLY